MVSERPLEPTPAAAPSRSVLERRRLAASRAVLELFLRERTTAFPVAALAAHAGISERSFYRYFPRKEDAVRPFLNDGLAELAARIEQVPHDVPMAEAIVAGFVHAFETTDLQGWPALMPVLTETEAMRATVLQVMTDGELLFAALFAERLHVDATSPRARLAGAVLIAAARVAMDALFDDDAPRDPLETFAESLRLLGPELFTPELFTPEQFTPEQRHREQEPS